jgi:hypothetical protein
MFDTWSLESAKSGLRVRSATSRVRTNGSDLGSDTIAGV